LDAVTNGACVASYCAAMMALMCVLSVRVYRARDALSLREGT